MEGSPRPESAARIGCRRTHIQRQAQGEGGLCLDLCTYATNSQTGKIANRFDPTEDEDSDAQLGKRREKLTVQTADGLSQPTFVTIRRVLRSPCSLTTNLPGAVMTRAGTPRRR